MIRALYAAEQRRRAEVMEDMFMATRGKPAAMQRRVEALRRG